MTYDPARRVTAKAALHHKYFDDLDRTVHPLDQLTHFPLTGTPAPSRPDATPSNPLQTSVQQNAWRDCLFMMIFNFETELTDLIVFELTHAVWGFEGVD